MNRGHSWALCHLAVLAICVTGMVSMSCAAKFAGHQAETVVPFGIGEMQPELTGPFMYRSMVTKVGTPDKEGLQRVRLVFDAKNLTGRDYRVYLTALLLDEQGKTVAMKQVKEKINDEERERIRLRFKKMTPAQIETVKEVRIKVSYEKE